MTQQILARGEREARVAVFPDLRNVGILARALVLYMAMVMAYAIATTARPADGVFTFSVALAESLPVAAFVGASWALASPMLRRLAYWQAAALMVLLTIVLAAFTARWMDAPVWRAVPLALMALTAALVYFHTLGRALSPAVTEARLQALQARIRPHFLFNSINGVLGVLRAEPRRAEAALMDMADLFRVLMRENRELQPIGDEITLTRQYLDLEKLRLGDRLNVIWKLEKMPADALVPPLVLQPIAENAVYHGIEPTQAAGTIEIEVTRLRSELIITVKNPFLEQAGAHHGGNKMAMSNIRERLALHFDAEARMVAGPRDGRYQVQLVLPYRKSLDAKAMV
jgi:two-component system, LytTR family, sensor histidine kinase AlgZ